MAKGTLSNEVHDRLLERLVEEDCYFDHVIYQWLGDPSLHPALEDLLIGASQRLAGRVGYLRADTNGILFGEQRLDRLVAGRNPDVPLLLVFTLDAASPDTYRRVKGRDGLLRVRRHVRHLLRRRRHSANLHLQVQFVVQRENAHEAGAFLSYWRDAWACHGREGGFFEVLFKPLSVDGGAAGQAESDRLYRTTLEEQAIFPEDHGGFAVRVWEDPPWQAAGARGPCAALWMTPVVRHDGRLQMCCADLQGQLGLGSVQEHGFGALWQGRRATELRLAQLQGKFEGPCVGCAGVNWYRLNEEHVASTYRRAMELGLTQVTLQPSSARSKGDPVEIT